MARPRTPSPAVRFIGLKRAASDGGPGLRRTRRGDVLLLHPRGAVNAAREGRWPSDSLSPPKGSYPWTGTPRFTPGSPSPFSLLPSSSSSSTSRPGTSSPSGTTGEAPGRSSPLSPAPSLTGPFSRRRPLRVRRRRRQL